MTPSMFKAGYKAAALFLAALAWLKALRIVLKSPTTVSRGESLWISVSIGFLYWLLLFREIGWIDK